jgi:uncharacterized protein YdaU (DUF1376 family)
MHYYQFNIGDYQSHTNHLDPLEDLAYRRMLDWCYLHEKPLPLDANEIARIIRLRGHTIIVQNVLKEFFSQHDEGWDCDRVLEEIQHYKAKIEQASRAGKASAERRSNGGSTDVQLTNNHKPITNNQIKPSICPPNGELGPAPIKKLPECNHKAVIELYHENLPTMRRVEVWNETRAGYLRQRWREVATELAQEKAIEVGDVLNWWAEFFQSVGKSRFLTGRVNSKDGRAFVADLEWILKPSNFAKIVEGKYHGNH